MEHTPGPWTVRTGKHIGRSAYYIDPVNARNTRDSLCVAITRKPWPVEEAWANACLIAAAPTLLEAAQAALDAYENGHTMTVDRLHKLQAAIREATQ